MTASVMGYGDPYEYKQYFLAQVEDYKAWLADKNYWRSVYGMDYGMLWVSEGSPSPTLLYEGDVFAFVPNTSLGMFISEPVEQLDPVWFVPAPVYVSEEESA